MGVKRGSDTVWPKAYSERPHAPMAVRIDAFGRDAVGTAASRARSKRSVCVVALEAGVMERQSR